MTMIRPRRGSRRRSAATAGPLLAVLTALFWVGVPAGPPPGPPADAMVRDWVLPVGPPGGPADVVRGFDPPEHPWSSGHRGVDLRAEAGTEVRAGAAGEVTYAGLLAGRGVVVVSHGSIRTTYEPVDPVVGVGSQVTAGDPLGTLDRTGSHCAPLACLHWGAIRGDHYLDPLTMVGAGAVRLLRLDERTLTERPPPPPPVGSARLDWPLTEPRVTSPYGMRTHPVTGVRKLHDGTDFGAACGTPVRAAASGVVTEAADRGAYGLRVGIDHGVLGENTMSTSYSHLSRIGARPRDVVAQGTVIGWVGTTGLSTGCHLHFMVYVEGSLADPMRWLPGAASGKQPGTLRRTDGGQALGCACR